MQVNHDAKEKTENERLNHPNIIELAKKYDKTPAQVLVRWSLQHDIIVIPKSIHEAEPFYQQGSNPSEFCIC